METKQNGAAETCFDKTENHRGRGGRGEEEGTVMLCYNPMPGTIGEFF